MVKNFTYINEDFTCMVCKEEVKALRSGCRNHCPFCLSSLHLDINPGDRMSSCKGVMKAISYEFHSKKGLMLIHKCTRCGLVKPNKAAYESPVQSDNYSKILSLTLGA